MAAQTRLLEDNESIAFEDLFELEDIQRLQDEFAKATGVASIITRTDGTPITRPSNFCRLCSDIIHETDSGRTNCFSCHAVLGRFDPDGPTIQPCMNIGLYCAGAGIAVGGKQVANWLIGQVRDDTQTEEKIREYAREIGADEEEVVSAFREVPIMSREQFGQVAQALFTLANQLSITAYQNVKQARTIAERDQVEEALRQSEQRYRELFSNANDIIYIHDLEGNFLSVNPRVEETLGYTAEEALQMNLADIVAPESLPLAREMTRRKLRGSEDSTTYEINVIAKDGRPIPLDVSTRLIHEDGQPTGVQGIARDITERKQAEEVLLSEKPLSEEYINSLPGLFYVFDEERLVRWNKQWEITGYSDEELATKHGTDFFEGKDKTLIGEQILKVFDEGFAEAEAELAAKDGRKIPCYFTGLRKELNGRKHFVGLGIDITQRRQAEAALRESEQRYRLIAENISDVIWTMDMDLRFTYVSPSVIRLRGYLPDEVIQQTLAEMLTPESLRVCMNVLEQESSRERSGEADASRSVTIETEQYCRDGSTVWTESQMSFLRDSVGSPLGILGVTRDISERKKAEERERELQTRAEEQEKLAAVGQLAAGIAHDFNNLLTGILGYAEMMSINTDLPQQFQSSVRVIQQQGQRAAQLIQQILDFSRKSIRQPLPVDLLPFLKETVHLLQRTIPEHISIKLDYTPGSYVIQGDLTQLQQVVTNLAVNARDAMADGGELRIRLSSLTLSPDESHPLPDMPAGEWVVLSVSDTGTGIPKETLHRIFEPFFTTKEVGQGSGLGLSQVYGIVKQHEGFLDVQSVLDEGTTFVLYFPARAVQVDSTPAGGKDDIPQGKGERILVVEDDSVVLDVLRQTLRALGYDVLTARNGQEGLELYRQYQAGGQVSADGNETAREEQPENAPHPGSIALVLTDIVMPGMGGVELCHALRRLNPNVKVVLISGYPLGEEARELLTEGVVDWIQKPSPVKKLAQIIRGAM